MRLVIFGLGYTAHAIARTQIARGWQIAATVRSAAKAQAVATAGLTTRLFSDAAHDPQITDDIASADAALISIPPLADGDVVLRRFADALARAPRLAWIGYLSTVGVYGDRDGGWVDETIAPAPTEPRSQVRAEIERAWLAFGAAHARPTHLFRLAGIYGPDRNALKQLAAGSARRIVKPGQVFNRIHVEDIAATVAASLKRPRHGAIYNLSDEEPAPPQDVVAYAADLCGVAPPPEVALDQAGLSPMGRSFYAECKRVDGRRTRAELGVSLRYPTYREGLAALRAAGEGPA
jgi:nucleoside-diphosphate-sugar epimerase